MAKTEHQRTKILRSDQTVKLPRIDNDTANIINSQPPQSQDLFDNSDEYDFCRRVEYRPSLNRWESDETIEFQEENEAKLRHLAATLGIDGHSRGKCARDLRWKPVQESFVNGWWKQSKKWKKHNEETKISHHYHDNSTRQYNRQYRKKQNPVVNVPGIGCSYRLPVVRKRFVK